jgi:hypothetical protein
VYLSEFVVLFEKTLGCETVARGKMFDEKPEAKISFRLAFKPHIVGIPIFDIF